ncbi:class I SAM-dependent methyltransferase [Methylacidimicrobium tartarophylax]|uniref:Methyltransferase domain-containing protein n=1 Tax=Methylacidimicrobium tartarophylax TaxID=1041768 RepID=A0A5E6MM68_9BACT|nr:class I SAM-dependent methyltransferase [Methylacidimicrobium tartarophylax]VVM06514.1 hypothetical protein MAMT_01255 [Methylacidimicrobium tartarophylax]
MEGFLKSVLTGGNDRGGRFHNWDGKFIGWREMGRLPENIFYFIQSKCLGERPELPWWPFPAVDAVNAVIRPESMVIEFGSGSSTLWLARRAREVVSIESDPNWHERVDGRLRKCRISNVTLLLRDPKTYSCLDDFAERYLDLAVVDGYDRKTCVRNVLSKLKKGGYLYLDNSDADEDCALNGQGEAKEAQKLIKAYCATHPGARLQCLSGLMIGNLQSSEGMLLQLSELPDDKSARQDTNGKERKEL